jgi:hypothetical protein
MTSDEERVRRAAVRPLSRQWADHHQPGGKAGGFVGLRSLSLWDSPFFKNRCGDVAHADWRTNTCPLNPVHFLSSCSMRQHIHDSDPAPLPWNADEEEIQSMKKFDTIGSPIAIKFSNITLRDFVFARSREAVAVGEAWSAIVGRRLFARPAPCTYSISHVDTAVSAQLEG